MEMEKFQKHKINKWSTPDQGHLTRPVVDYVAVLFLQAFSCLSLWTWFSLSVHATRVSRHRLMCILICFFICKPGPKGSMMKEPERIGFKKVQNDNDWNGNNDKNHNHDDNDSIPWQRKVCSRGVERQVWTCLQTQLGLVKILVKPNLHLNISF